MPLNSSGAECTTTRPVSCLVLYIVDLNDASTWELPHAKVVSNRNDYCDRQWGA